MPLLASLNVAGIPLCKTTIGNFSLGVCGRVCVCVSTTNVESSWINEGHAGENVYSEEGEKKNVKELRRFFTPYLFYRLKLVVSPLHNTEFLPCEKQRFNDLWFSSAFLKDTANAGNNTKVLWWPN